MGIQIGGGGKVRRDWVKIASAAAEAVIQALALGKEGFGHAISAFFRMIESLRGNDDVEIRATRLTVETLAYAASATIAVTALGRTPEKLEVQTIIDNLIARALSLANQKNIELLKENLEYPASFPLFGDASSQIFHELRLCHPKETEANISARFQLFVSEGLNRIRARDPEYFSTVISALTGLDSDADARARAWLKYRSLLIRRFEDEPLFGEDKPNGVTLGQVYQPLRAWWDDIEFDEEAVPGSDPIYGLPKGGGVTRHVEMLDVAVLKWLEVAEKTDRIRLVSGGPGSGKSTFAKQLAARLAQEPRWRVLFVPLQRIRGAGPLEARIDEYFRLHGDEPFRAETVPLASMDRDGHRDWLIIFDGLDELAKEGASSESAAQDFASALADWRGRIGQAAVRFLVLGRAPSMQEARRRLGLQGSGTLNVDDMLPWDGQAKERSNRRIKLNDPAKLTVLDQRLEFWKRWAVAKQVSPEPPNAMKAGELVDLTKEPLLAYLLILSGFASDRWKEAAENRNRIYRAIFDQIWDRERSKDTRIHLNDLGKEGFEALMQALGLAAWRGGGRTGDEETFKVVRDTFVRPDLLAKARACGAAELSNVALLFYTKRDEEGGRGYEFLHKSFGEYLTACGLASAFQRWGTQVAEPTSDFDQTEFMRRWLRLSGPAPMTWYILEFLRNEVRLRAFNVDRERPWSIARQWMPIAKQLLDLMMRDGLPAFEGATKWTAAAVYERNSEEALLAMSDACARVAYPTGTRTRSVHEGGWEAGPVEIPFLLEDRTAFGAFLSRVVPYYNGWGVVEGVFYPHSGSIAMSCLSRLSLRGSLLYGRYFPDADFEGCDLSEVGFEGTVMTNCNLSYTQLERARLEGAVILRTIFAGADMRKTHFRRTKIDRFTRSWANKYPPIGQLPAKEPSRKKQV